MQRLYTKIHTSNQQRLISLLSWKRRLKQLFVSELTQTTAKTLIFW